MELWLEDIEEACGIVQDLASKSIFVFFFTVFRI